MKLISKCPLLICVLVSTILLTVIGWWNPGEIFTEYREMTGDKPVIAAVFLGIKDGVSFGEEQPLQTMAPVDEVISEPEDETKQTVQQNKEQQNIQPDKKAEEESVKGQEYDVQQPGDSVQSDADSVEDMPIQFMTVQEEYFDDALFIGDSRTQGMFEYGGLEERAAFYCRTSLTIYDLFEKDKEFIRIGDEKLTLRQALSRQQFKKIYLMLGINELGTGTPESFLSSYTAAVEEIRQMQPEAIIFIQGILNVTAKKSESDPIFNNENINIRNELLRTLADGRNIFYLDVNEEVCDEEGNLFEDWTFDQIHLKAQYYQVWKEFLMQHGILKNSRTEKML